MRVTLRRQINCCHWSMRNRLDRTLARQVWFNFRETRLTDPKSYFARLSYTHQNPVKHGLVPVANQYPWYCLTPLPLYPQAAVSFTLLEIFQNSLAVLG